jgi:hypothetical protein
MLRRNTSWVYPFLEVRMKSLNVSIEALEGRRLLSAAPGLLGYEGQPGNQGGGGGQQGYEGQPGNQGGGGSNGTPNGLKGYEGQPGNQGG